MPDARGHEGAAAPDDRSRGEGGYRGLPRPRRHGQGASDLHSLRLYTASPNPSLAVRAGHPPAVTRARARAGVRGCRGARGEGPGPAVPLRPKFWAQHPKLWAQHPTLWAQEPARCRATVGAAGVRPSWGPRALRAHPPPSASTPLDPFFCFLPPCRSPCGASVGGALCSRF
jgi:hypothetical protein